MDLLIFIIYPLYPPISPTPLGSLAPPGSKAREEKGGKRGEGVAKQPPFVAKQPPLVAKACKARGSLALQLHS
jgi:hypothetical protein